MLRFSNFGLRAFTAAAFVWSIAGEVAAQPAGGRPSRIQALLEEGDRIDEQLRRALRLDCLEPETVDVLSNLVEAWISKTSRERGQPTSMRVAPLTMRFKIKDLREKPPCGRASTWTGPFVGVHGIIASGTMRVDEKSAATGVTTFQSSDSTVGGGAGIQFGHGFTPFNNNVIVTPFVSLDYLNLNVQHTFSPGIFYSQRTNFIGTAGVDVGLALPEGVQLFLRGGVGAVNQETKINFGGPVTSESNWNAAGVVGGGVTFDFLKAFAVPTGTGFPTSITYMFATLEFEHYFIADTKLNRPAASPFSNYKFDSDVNVVKAGVRVNVPSIFERDSILRY